ncbi:MAG: hypothetical protein K2G54_00050 [Malacoplasma sp.]|nr:hypothetical protein [Malacoplasma sp.]MDE5952927.1 hypothetical protein [Malacoplasma sp.]MDE7088011.1 hypothetical protein [Malacoplasma sp.]
MNKKKILESVLVGTSALAIGVGVGVPAAIVSNQQSSNIDIKDNNKGTETPSDENTNIETPSDEKETEKLASAPQQAIYEGVINWGEAKDKDTLNDYLYSKFHEGTSQSYDVFKDLLENNSEFANVNIEYVENSANYESSSFEIKVTPIQDYSWNDKTNESKNILVEIPNLDKTEWTSIVPQSLSYSATIDGKDVKNTSQLNTYLSNSFSSSNLNLDTKLDAKLIENSASFENKNFKVAVAPKSGFAWTDGSSKAVEVTVSVKISELKYDAASISNDNYKVSLNLNQVSNSKAFNEYLMKNFRAMDLEKFALYKNVEIKYVENSASYDTNQFKVSITPVAGHAFSDDKSIEPRIRVVNGGLNKDFANFDTKTLAQTSGVFKDAPYLIVTNNNDAAITYSISNWSYDWEFYRNLEGWSTYWCISTDSGKTWERAGYGKSVTVNKAMLPDSGLFLRYEIEAKETDVSVFGESDSFIAYRTLPIKVLN